MIFKSKNKKIPQDIDPIMIGNEEINRVSCTKFLGIYIDDKLTWTTQVIHVKNKLSKAAGIMYKARPSLNVETLKCVYYSFVYPYLYYGIIAWGNTYESYLSIINTVHKRIIRTMASARKYEHTEPIFSRFKLLTFQQIYKYNCAMFMFKRFHLLLPVCFNEMFRLNIDVHTHHTRQSDFFVKIFGNWNVCADPFVFRG